MENRFALFIWESGSSSEVVRGWNSFRSLHKSQGDAMRAARKLILTEFHKGGGYHIVDLATQKKVNGYSWESIYD